MIKRYKYSRGVSRGSVNKRMERFRKTRTRRERQFRVVSKNRFTPTFLSAVQIGLVALFQCSGYNHARQPSHHRVSGVGRSSPGQAPVIKTHSEPVLVSSSCVRESAQEDESRAAHTAAVSLLSYHVQYILYHEGRWGGCVEMRDSVSARDVSTT